MRGFRQPKRARARLTGALLLYLPAVTARLSLFQAALPGSDEIQEKLDDILSRPEFAPPEPGFVERALSWLGEQLAKLFSLFVDENGRADVLMIVLVTLMAAALTYLTVRLIKKRRAPDVPAPRPPVPTLKDDTASDLLRHADELAQGGALSDAFSYLMYAYLKSLSEAGLLTLMPGRTNRQYQMDLLRSGQSAASVFTPFCQAFNERRYGDAPTLKEDYDLWRDRLFARREAAV